MSGPQGNPSEEERLKRLETALELVWRIHLHTHVHLGLERYGGVSEHCIPCICAAALNKGMDEVSTQHLIETLDAVRSRGKDFWRLK